MLIINFHEILAAEMSEILGPLTVEGTRQITNILSANPLFQQLSKFESVSLMQRDIEDEEKLALGIKQAVEEGYLQPVIFKSPYRPINVDDKSVGTIADDIMQQLGSPDRAKGNSIVLAGISGIGKGTTVKELSKRIPNSYIWSNGTIFRTIAWQYQEHYPGLPLEQVGNFAEQVLADIYIQFDYNRLRIHLKKPESINCITDLQDNIPRSPKLERLVPLVAQRTQGQVINFTKRIIDRLDQKGRCLILEGRKATLDYIPSPYRFELIADDLTVLGKRRAAQKIAEQLPKGFDPDTSFLTMICQGLLDEHLGS